MMQKRHSVLTAIVAGAGAAVLAACATTSFTSTWKAPDVKPFNAAGKKVVGLVMTENEGVRRAAEDALARELTARGAQGVAAYTLIPDAKAGDEDAAKAALEAAGVVGVVALRPVGTDQTVTSTPSAATAYYPRPYYRGFWHGYWGYGWGGAWGPSEVRTNTIVTVETLVYSLADNALVWAGQSRTTNPEKVDAFVRELVGAAAKEMKKQGLL